MLNPSPGTPSRPWTDEQLRAWLDAVRRRHAAAADATPPVVARKGAARCPSCCGTGRSKVFPGIGRIRCSACSGSGEANHETKTEAKAKGATKP